MTRFIVLSTLLFLASCTPAERQDVSVVLGLTKALCIVDRQALPDSEVASICGIAGPLLDAMQQLLASVRGQSMQAATAARKASCSSNAWMPDAGVKP